MREGTATPARVVRLVRPPLTAHARRVTHFTGPHKPDSFPGEPEHAELLHELHQSDPVSAGRIARALFRMPVVGSTFLGFRLVAELGRGAFSRVYLAQQGDQADRLVTLKVSADLRGEPLTPAPLQHTNIVPVYSVHHAQGLQAVCMPFFGATTLADLLRHLRRRESLPSSARELLTPLRQEQNAGRDDLPSGGTTATVRLLEGLSYVDAVVWLAARLADGLGHVHEHGIVYRGLQPANVLLADDGQPMLFDCTRAVHARLPAAAAVAAAGGTLPYMAPEHLRAIGGKPAVLDARCDLFAFGVLLYELLTGRHPYTIHDHRLVGGLELMIRERGNPPPGPRTYNPAVSPALEAIVCRLLLPDPADRYQTAAELREDLECQRADLPLRHTPEPSVCERAAKWRRRHRRLASVAAVALAAAVLAGLGALLLAGG